LHFQGKTVYNRSKGIEIILAKSGEKHFLSNYKLEINDFIASKYLDKIIESSVFISQGKYKKLIFQEMLLVIIILRINLL